MTSSLTHSSVFRRPCLILMLISTFSYAAHLSVEPSFLLIPEDWPVGKDVDVTICPGKIRILTGNEGHFFSVSPLNDSCSTLILNSQLDADRETDTGHGQSFSLVLSGPRNSRATLDIQVVDVNDNPPVFINTPASVTVMEDTAENTIVAKIRTKDVDTGVAGLARYSLEDEHFYLDKRKCSNGECWTSLRLKKQLNYEAQRIHQLTIIAEDGDPHMNHTNKAEHQMSVQVIDVQDSPPQWLTDFTQPIIVDKNTKPGDEILVLRAIDGDKMSEKANAIKYTAELSEFVSVDSKSGSVTLKKTLPSNTEIKLTVTAREDDSVGMSSKAILRLKSVATTTIEPRKVTSLSSVQICKTPVTTAKIAEGSKEFEPKLIVSFNEPLNFESLSLESDKGAFQLKQSENDKNSVEITVVNTDLIDYEQQQKMEFYVSTPQGKCKVEVDVEDVNDNKPKFTHDTFLFYLTENEPPTILREVKATDADSDAFLPINYTLIGEGSEFFDISSEGVIRSLKPIDREQHERFDLIVRATDAGGLWTDCPGKIVIKDVNDNAPQFEKSEYEIEVNEEKSTKIRVTATDADIGENAQIVYSIEHVDEGTPIDISSGILFIGKMDRDTMDSDRVQIVVKATDKGVPSLSSTANVTIIVKDINDNYPVFSNSKYSIVVDANISPGGVIGAVKAEDGDATSPNNYVSYNTSDSKFKVTDNGEIIFTGPGILSKDSSMEFTVKATDGGTPQRNATSKVIINEHKASMQSELTTELLGNETINRTEIKWTNSGMAGYSYEIVKATADGYKDSEVAKWVEINRQTGVIHTLKSLTPDMVKQIRLYISMTKGKREVPVELIIKIVDSDNPPTFKKEVYKTTVSEDIANATKIMQVKAAGDSDNQFKYALVILQGPKEALAIDKTGWIIANQSLDFETNHYIRGRVVAEDEVGNVAATNFSIQLTDANDNRPVFKNGSVFTITIPESTAVGSILDLPYPLATDADSGKHAELRYSILSGDDHFSVDVLTSQVKLVSMLDYENQRTHFFTLRCLDNAGKYPSNEAFAAITVKVEDVNDNVPVLHNSDLMHLTVSEDAAASTLVTVLSVTDADEGNHQKVKLDANHTLFRIDDENRIVVASELKGYAGERICSSLIATDTGEPPLNASFPYCVTVYPASNNQHNPLIVSPKPNSIHYFDENVNYDELIKIKLLDEGDMKNIDYRLDKTFKKDWDFFAINSTGSLTSKAPFDFEKKNVHELKIKACRATNCSSVHVFLSVNDRNDNCPIFPKQDVRLSLTENDKSPTPRQIGRLPAALDADFHADNTKVCYTTDSPMFFFNDPTLPVLFTNHTFDREQHKQHQITIVAYDCLLACRDPHKPMNSTITGIIEVLDVNDNFPRFSERSYRATVIQGQASPGSHLTSISATDPDEEKEGLKYSIKGNVRAGKHSYGLSESPINVDKSTGEVSANDVLKEPMYSFTASVVDGAGHEDTASVMISVVTYSQQTELLFDAPFDFIVRNEKHIVSLLSDATSMTAVVDRCRQNSNFTLVLAHFLDSHEQFVHVDKAVELLMQSNSTAKRELRNSYGLRDAVAPLQARTMSLEIFAIGAVAALAVLLLFIICIWCRQKNTYSNKLRQISAQAAAHQATLGRPLSKKNPPGFYVDGLGPLVSGGRMMAPPPPLQSTEL